MLFGALSSSARGAITNINPTQVPLVLLSTEVIVECYGAVAETSLKLTFYNPNPWRVGGETEFRFSDDSALIGLSVNTPDGTMKAGIPISVQKRSYFFDDMDRMGNDGSKLEMLRSGLHKIRIFPVEANQSRAVEIRLFKHLQAADENGNDLLFEMPFSWRVEGESKSSRAFDAERSKLFFSFKMNVHGNERAPYALNKNGGKLFFKKTGSIHQYEYTFDPESGEAHNAVFDNRIRAILPGAGHAASRVQSTGEGKFFYTTVSSGHLAALIQSNDLPSPAKIGIAWDSSLSGRRRDWQREVEFLDEYFRYLLYEEKVPEVQVSLLRFRNDIEKIEEFVVDKKSGWQKLRKELASTIYDGATNFCVVRSETSSPMDEWLLFSDGYENYGMPSAPKKAPVLHAIISNPTAYVPTMRHFATMNGGLFIDLSVTPAEKAVRRMRLPRAWLSHIEGNGVEDVFASSRTIGSNEVMLLSGRLVKKDGSLKLTFEGLGTEEISKTIAIPLKSDAPASPLAAQEWARLKIDDLFAKLVTNDALKIQQLGRDFGIVSLHTSVVLPTEGASQEDGLLLPASSPQAYAAGANDENAYPPEMLRQEWADMLNKAREIGSKSLSFTGGDFSGPVLGDSGRRKWVDVTPNMIHGPFLPYDDGALYIERLRSAPVQRAYDIYLSEMQFYWMVPEFFLDTSNVLFEYGLSDLGLRVLSNLAEIDSDNKWLLRTLGYRLLELGSPQARVLFEKIVQLDPDDPQSLRDLAWACGENGDVDRAVELLNGVLTRKWHESFRGVQLASLWDLNTIVSGFGEKLDLGKIDSALLNFTPIDIRIKWAVDRHNADLRVQLTDAAGAPVERGLMTLNFPPGQGCNEIIVPKASKGKYSVQVGYADHVPQENRASALVMFTLVTNIGTKMQNDKIVTVFLSPNQNGMKTAAEFDFNAEPAIVPTEAVDADKGRGKRWAAVAGFLAVAVVAVLVGVLPRRR